MFISVLDIFKIGIGPSSSHTMGPMVAAWDFAHRSYRYLSENPNCTDSRIVCILKGSLAHTGRGHATDRAIVLGLAGFTPAALAGEDVKSLVEKLRQNEALPDIDGRRILFSADTDIVFDLGEPLPQHPNGMVFQLVNLSGNILCTETYFSIGGGFICTLAEIGSLAAPLRIRQSVTRTYEFDSAASMIRMAEESGLSIAEMKRVNENQFLKDVDLDARLDDLWRAMRQCVEKGLDTDGILPGGINIPRRAKGLYAQIAGNPAGANLIDWLCAYAMAVSEENAAGNMVVTAPTNGAAGVIPAVLYYLVKHEDAGDSRIRDFLLTAAAIGGIIKHRSSISGAEVGCQGEVGSASSMAAAGLCAVLGGSPEQVENAAEIAMEHHLGMTCDPVGGLVQVPCIERNGFGAIKAYTAASLALKGSGKHFMSLDNCIAAMKQTGMEMSDKFKETSRGGLAVSITEC